ncbi:MAG TPA: shikimate kinase, partial [Pyrinomonadaceae bacterium]
IEEDGEARFRELESLALRDALERGDDGAHVIALGGGTWTISHNRALIEEHKALTVWLDAPFELCWQRIMKENGSRPLAPDFERALRLYDERRDVYDQAQLRVEVDEERSADAIAAEIASALARRLE